MVIIGKAAAATVGCFRVENLYIDKTRIREKVAGRKNCEITKLSTSTCCPRRGIKNSKWRNLSQGYRSASRITSSAVVKYSAQLVHTHIYISAYQGNLRYNFIIQRRAQSTREEVVARIHQREREKAHRSSHSVVVATALPFVFD